MNATIYMFGFSHELLDSPGEETPAPEPVGYFMTEELAMQYACKELSGDGQVKFIETLHDGLCNVYLITSRIGYAEYIYVWTIKPATKR